MTAPLIGNQGVELRQASDAAPVKPAPEGLKMRQSFPLARYALLLGLFTAAGPIGIDLCLPAFPEIQNALATGAGPVQLSLVSYFVALAVGQLAYGPLSDRYGRRGPLAIGFAIFLVASVGAALSPSIGALIGWRFVQGLGSCAGMVIARSIARDLESGARAAKLFAMMVLVLGVSPILAPSLGAGLISYSAWPITFWFMAGFAIVTLLVIALLLEETLAPAHRAADLSSAFVMYRRLLIDKSYLRAVLTGAFAQAGFFAYLAGSPQVLISLHGVSPAAYSLLFGLNALALIGSAQLTAPLLRRLAPDRVVGVATVAYLALAIALLAATSFRFDGLVATVVLLFLVTACLGTIAPITTMQAVENNPDAAGAASALMGSIQFGAGALASIMLSQIADDSARPLAAIIGGCAMLAAVTHYLPWFRRPAIADPRLKADERTG